MSTSTPLQPSEDAVPDTDNRALSFCEMLDLELQEIDEKEKLQRDEHRLDAERNQHDFRAHLTLHDAVRLFPARKRRDALRDELAHEQRGSQEEHGDKRDPLSSIDEARRRGLAGLAFSGGGIRSATFNLGVLQGLAKRSFLHQFHYLSTVSGGGYIGGWLAGWIHRRGMREVEARLGASRKDQPECKEPPEIRSLREYSNYLTPRKGFLGADTWTAIAIYLRNLTLNQLVLILFISAVLLAPRALAAFLVEDTSLFVIPHRMAAIVVWILIAAVLCIVAVISIGINMRNYSVDPDDRVLARVTRVDGKRLDVTFLVENHEQQRLLESNPEVEIWDPAIRINRTASRRLRVRDSDQALAWIELSEVVNDHHPGHNFEAHYKTVVPGDLLIAVYPRLARPKWIFLLTALPVFLAATFLSCFCYADSVTGALQVPHSFLWWFQWSSIALALLWWFVFFILFHNIDQSETGWSRKIASWIAIIVGPFVAGACGGFLLSKTVPLLWHWAGSGDGSWRVLGFGTPLLILIFLLFTVIHIGMLGVCFAEPRREWWGRLAGTLLITCFVWAAAFALAGYGPLLITWLLISAKSKWAAGVAWVVTTGFGLAAGKSSKLGGADSSTWKDKLLSITPYVFILGLLLLVSFGWHYGLRQHECHPVAETTALQTATGTLSTSTSTTATTTAAQTATTASVVTSTNLNPAGYWANATATLRNSTPLPWIGKVHTIYLLVVACFVAAFLLALRIDLNEFSMQYLYRNRLVRCYLGASNRERVPNPFTGFDESDDIYLADLTSRNVYDGPIPIFCSALNLVKGQDLAWQERKAESFCMTPLCSGYDVWFEQLPRPGQIQKRGLEMFGYRPTHSYVYPGGPYVGTAMAISGAAASPNMGYHSSPALSFLLTVFNIRLGSWVGNTRHPKTWQNAGPQLGLGYLLAELFGATDDSRKYVYLSDGGHFENLGIYELVKRRCRFILASDADADKDLAFGDLASAIRKCRSDMGIDIKLRTQKIIAWGTPPFSSWHCAVGEILYNESDPGAESANNQNGILVYIKASLTSDEPADVLNYKSRCPDFPHETTADQWFTESQFESYRALGAHVIETLFDGVQPPLDFANGLTESFKGLAGFWNDPDQLETNV